MIRPTQELRAVPLLQMILLTLGVPMLFRGSTPRHTLSLLQAVLTALPLIPALWVQGKLAALGSSLRAKGWNILSALFSLLWGGLYLSRSAGIFASIFLPYAAETIFIAGLSLVLFVALLLRPAALGQMAAILSLLSGILLAIMFVVVLRHIRFDQIDLWRPIPFSQWVAAAGTLLLALMPFCAGRHIPADSTRFRQLAPLAGVIVLLEGVATGICTGTLGAELNSRAQVPMMLALAQNGSESLLTGNNVLFCCVLLFCVMGLLLNAGLTIGAIFPQTWPHALQAGLVVLGLWGSAIALRHIPATELLAFLLGIGGFMLFGVLPWFLWGLHAVKQGLNGNKKTER